MVQIILKQQGWNKCQDDLITASTSNWEPRLNCQFDVIKNIFLTLDLIDMFDSGLFIQLV